MALPGYNSQLYVGGTSTVMTAEPTTHGSGNNYQITNVNKRVIDPSFLPVVKDGGVAILDANVSAIDYLFGNVTLASPPGGAVTIDAHYIPLLPVAGGYSANVAMTNADLDCTEFGLSYVKRVLGLSSFALSFEVWDVFRTDLDPGGGTRKIQDLVKNKTLCLLAFRPDTSSNKAIRSWGFVTKAESKAGVSDMVGGSVEFVGTSRFDASGRGLWFKYST